MKIFEYMAVGKPVIAPDYHPIREVIRDGIDGLLFPPLSVSGFRSRLLALLNDGALRRELGHTAKTRVLSQFTWDVNAKKVLEFSAAESTADCSSQIQCMETMVP
jgi:glycosyltransferase involved in cell wall biosynthesis